jgi:dipeptidyl aminopeptidase/acylaminoacyl peptidase
MYEIGSVAAKASEVKIPWLLIHGDTDDVVPIEDSREIFNLANEPKKIFEIPGANHVFSEAALEPMSEAVIDWIGEILRG